MRNFQNFRILTEDKKQAMSAKLAEKSMLDFIEQSKATGAESGTFKIVISSEDQDRHGDVILVDGWDTSFFEKNPVVLWAHDYDALPIGMATKVYKEGKQLIAEGIFAPAEANPKAQQVRKLYELGMMNATSIGAIVLEQKDNVISKAELLEFSFVPVPANPYALRLNEIGENVAELVAKGLMLAEISKKLTGEEYCCDCGEKLTEESVRERRATNDVVELICNKCLTKTKGAVNDELNGNTDIMDKYGNLDKAFEIIYAFCDVYLRGETPATEFGSLLSETADLLKGLAAGAEPTSSVEAAQKAFTPETKRKAIMGLLKALKVNKTLTEEVAAILTKLQAGVDEIIVNSSQEIIAATQADDDADDAGDEQKEADVMVKEGRVLSKKNRELVNKAIESTKASIAALEELYKATDPDGGASQDDPDGDDEINKGRDPQGGDEIVAPELKFWLGERQLLRAVNNATSEALAHINKRVKTQS